MAGNLSTVEFQQALVLQAWQCLLGEAQVIYISGPITTGPRWIAAVETGNRAAHLVVEENCREIRAAASALRKKTDQFVLEPASLHVESWSQEHYLALWTTFIERHASAVTFVSGWPYSIGCALEFERAISHKITTSTLDGETVTPAAGAAAIREAAHDVAMRAAGAPELRALAQRLDEVAVRLAAVAS